METKLLIQGPLGPRNSKANRSLLRLIGQAHRFKTILEAAVPNSTMSEIAKVAGVSQSYFARVLRLSFLAPDITRMVLQGRQPPELSANRIMTQGKLSPVWAKQKEQVRYWIKRLARKSKLSGAPRPSDRGVRRCLGYNLVINLPPHRPALVPPKVP